MVKDAASKYITEKEQKEVKILEAFGSAMAERPINLEELSKRREDLRLIGGDELVVEASAVVANFAHVTKIVDTTGRKHDPQLIKFLQKIFFLRRHGSKIKYSLLTVLAIGTYALLRKRGV